MSDDETNEQEARAAIAAAVEQDPRLGMLNLRPAPDGGLTPEEVARAFDVPIPEGKCPYCEQSWKMDLPQPLTPDCDHAAEDPPVRLFADRVRFYVMKDGRLQVLQDLDDGRQVVTLVDRRDVERLRLALKRKGQAAMAERFRPD